MSDIKKPNDFDGEPDIEALEMAEHEAQARRILGQSDDVKPYTREELEIAAQRVNELYLFSGKTWIRMNPIAWERLLATARAGLEDRERLADAREVLAHVIDVLMSAMADAGIVRDSSLGSMYEQIAHELRRSREDRERLDRLPELWDRISRVDDDSATWEVYHGHSVRNADGSLSAKLTLYDDLRAAIDAARGGGSP